MIISGFEIDCQDFIKKLYYFKLIIFLRVKSSPSKFFKNHLTARPKCAAALATVNFRGS